MSGPEMSGAVFHFQVFIETGGASEIWLGHLVLNSPVRHSTVGELQDSGESPRNNL